MKAFRLVPYLFAAIGLALLAASGIVALNRRAFVGDAASAPGVVIDLSRQKSSSSSSSTSSGTYRPVVEFRTPEGKRVEFISGVGSNPPSHRVGEEVTVLYDPKDPMRARIDSFLSLWFVPALLGGMGLLFFAIGGGMIAVVQISRRRRGLARGTGQRVMAELQRVEPAPGGPSQGFRIVAHWLNPSDGKLYVLRSQPIPFDPSDYLPGEQIPVFVDPHRPSRHDFDLSFLPELGG